MRLAPATPGPARSGRLHVIPAPPTPSAALRGVLWRMHQRCAIASHRRPRGRDPLLRLHESLPLGHPEFIYTPNTVDLHPYFGLAKCSVLPPLGLYHPVLPYCTGDKLTFPLCRICVEDQLDLPLHAKTWHCPHTPEQRALTGTWCTPELEKAVEQGYVVQKIHEVWHFPQSHKGLFAKYVNTWLQIKEEASRVYHPGKPSPTHPQLCATGRHPLGLRPHRLQSQTMHLGQDDAELHVGKIWPMRQQDASPRIH